MPAPKTEPSVKIGKMLLGAGLITDRQLRDALALQKRKGSKIGSALVELGAIDEDVLATFLGMQLGIDSVPLHDRVIPKEILALVRSETAWRFGAVPVSKKGSVLTVALVDPNDRKALAALEKDAGCKVKGAIAPQTSIWAALKRHYSAASEGSEPKRTTVLDTNELRKKIASARRLLDEIDAALGE